MKTPSQLFDLNGRVAIVTGAGSGLGRAFSEALAAAGATVVCSGRRVDKLTETVQLIEARGQQAAAIAADVTNEQSVRGLVAATVERFGRLDILVNNAGTASVGSPEVLSLTDWQKVIDVNLTGVFLCAREAAAEMIREGRGGRIINVASILGACASEPVPATSYAAAKGGVINLTRDLAVHWAPYGILVNAIAPAYFPSEMTDGIFSTPEMVAEIERRTPLARTGTPSELHGPIVFLASDAASYMTGQTLFIDGGWTAW